MSSLFEPDPSFASSEVTESTFSNLYSKKRNAVQKHVRYTKKNKDKAKLYCSYCTTDNQPINGLYSTNLAGNLKKHIKKWHPDIAIEKTISQNQEAVNR